MPRSTSPARTAAAGGQGRRPQLPGHVQRGGLAAGLDTRDERRSRCTTRSSAQGCAGAAPQPAVSIGAGAIWMHVYDAVTTRRPLRPGRRVRDRRRRRASSRAAVSAASRRTTALAAAGLLEAEIVTADGEVRIANACTNPDLFWALKGGGGGSLGVVTRVTLRTRRCQIFSVAVNATIKAKSDAAYRRLIARFIASTRESLQPALGRAVKLSARQHVADRHGLPRTKPAAGKRGMEAILGLDHRVAGQFHPRIVPRHRGAACAEFLGSRDAAEDTRDRDHGRPAKRTGRKRVLDGEPR